VSGAPCVAYQYEVTPYVVVPATANRTATRQAVTAAAGFGRVPFSIRHPQGDLRVMGFPTLDDAFLCKVDQRKARSSLATYLVDHAPTVVPISGSAAIPKRIEALQREPRDRVEENWATSAQPIADEPKIEERRLAPGGEVVVFGRYVAADASIVPRPRFGGLAVQIYKGDPSEVLGTLDAGGILQYGLVAAVGLFLFLLPVGLMLSGRNTINDEYRHLSGAGRILHLLHLGPAATR